MDSWKLYLWLPIAAFFLDLLLGDPEWMPHPVVLMGKGISFLEKELRAIFPKTKKGEKMAGLILAVIMPLLSLSISGAVITGLALLSPYLGLIPALIWGWQVLAMCCLRKESSNVYRKVTGASIAEAREAVGRIVGRDTEKLTREGVIKATVETVAENFSDGVIAPLFYLMIGGVPLALCYKAINTMDSMVGYKNEKYLWFGRCAAKLDDVANYLPSRLSALLMILGSYLCHYDGKAAYRIWKRDRRKHASPNSAQTESVMAGALGIQLAGPASYFGVVHDKPTIGEATRAVEAQDIVRANRLMYVSGFLGLVLLFAVRISICLACLCLLSKA